MAKSSKPNLVYINWNDEAVQRIVARSIARMINETEKDRAENYFLKFCWFGMTIFWFVILINL